MMSAGPPSGAEFSLASSCVLVTPGTPGLPMHSSNLCLCLPMAFLCVVCLCIQIPSSYKDTAIGEAAAPWALALCTGDGAGSSLPPGPPHVCVRAVQTAGLSGLTLSQRPCQTCHGGRRLAMTRGQAGPSSLHECNAQYLLLARSKSLRTCCLAQHCFLLEHKKNHH